MNHKTNYSEVVKRVNFFTKPVTLLLLKETGHRTFLGLFFTLAIISVISLQLSAQIQSLIQRDNPTVLVTQGFLGRDDKISLNRRNFAITVSSTTRDLRLNYQLSIELNSLENGQSIKQQLPLVRCDSFELGQVSLNTYFSGSNQYCIDWDSYPELLLSGSLDFDYVRYLNIVLKQCGSQTSSCTTLPNPTDKIQLKIINSYSDIEDHNNPNKAVGKTININVSNQMTKNMEVTLQQLVTETDDGYIVPEVVRDSGLKVFGYQETSDPYNEDTLVRVTISMESIKQITKKSYPKLQQILGDLGGLFEILFISSLLFLLPIQNLSYTVSLLNELFNFEHNANDDTADHNLHPKSQLQIHPESNLEAVHLDSKETARKDSKSSSRLKSIFQKSLLLEKFNRQSKLGSKEAEQKNMIVEKISEEITQFFKEQETRLELDFWDYFPCLSCKKGGKRDLINYSLDSIKKTLDVTYMVKKLQEIDKLKLILLDADQLKLFDYLPKPKMHLNQNLSDAQYCSIMKPEQTDLQKALDAQKAFQNLQYQNNTLTKKLMSLIDDDLIQLFKIQLDKGVNRSVKKPTQLSEVVKLLIEQEQETKKQSAVEQRSNSESDSGSNSDSQSSGSKQRKKKKKQKLANAVN